MCHLCGKSVPNHLRAPVFRAGEYEPLAPVVDHVIPLSKGGPHTMDNCRLAHWTCNARKHLAEGLAEAEADVEPPSELHSHAVNPCKVSGCHREARTKQMCSIHHRRVARFGDPLTLRCGCGCGEMVTVPPAWTGRLYIDGHGIQYNAEDPADKLRRNLAAQPVGDRGRELHGLTDDCLLWTATKNERGYGVINFRTSKGTQGGGLVHRFAFEIAYGEGSAAGLSVDHLCGVPLCCNPKHLEAVPVGENLRRAALAITECAQGHLYDERNTHVSTTTGHRNCRQCTRNKYHLEKLGHDFVLDPENPSSAGKERCLTCRLERESTTQFCPYGHEYTPENKRITTQGKRRCIQCTNDRTHIPDFGHSFVLDTSNPSTKRKRCRVCVETATPVTQCFHGHKYTELTLEFGAKGHRKCVQCRLNKAHVPQYGHEFVIDPNFGGKARRCLICAQKKQAEQPTHCVNGHEFTALTTECHSTRGHRVCVQCRLNATHIPQHGHEFVIDPNHQGQLRRCLICAGG